ncbi:FkbM family methyltransferase [Janibacter sp. LM]|uniref:FkbM family methyltransferase n=1 Tax=Janibacter sp. LM TaxID=3144845 RepID=UPI0031F5FE6C
MAASPLPAHFPLTLVSVDGADYRICLPHAGSDYIQRQISTTGEPYEHEMLQAMAATLESDDLVLDIGANVGNHTLYLAGVVGVNVVAYEPDARLTTAIEESVSVNQLGERIRVRRAAVSDEPGEGVLVDDAIGNLGGQHLSTEPGAEGSTVPVIRLDDEMPQRRIRALKIDVEGHERLVLEGAAELLKRDHPDVWIECLDIQCYRDVVEFLQPRGYRFDSVYNASPTHRFVHGDRTTTQAMSTPITALMERFYSDHAAYLSTRDSLEEANRKYRLVTQQLADLKAKSAEGNARLADRVNELTSAADAQNPDAWQRVTAAEEGAERAEQQRQGAVDRARRLEAELAELTSKHTTLAVDYDERVTTLLEAGQQLRRQLSDARETHSREVAEFRQRLREIEAAVADERRGWEEERETGAEELGVLQRERDEATADLDDANHQIEALTGERDHAHHTLAERDTELTDLRPQLEDLTTSRDQAQAALDDASHQIEALTGERDHAHHTLAERDTELTDLRPQLEDLTTSRDQAQAALDDASHQIEALTGERDHAHHTLAERDTELTDLRPQLEDLTTSRDQAQAALDDARHQIEALTGERDHAHHTLAERDTELTDLRHRQARYREDFDVLRRYVATSSEELETLRAEAAELRMSLAEQTDRSGELLGELDQERGRIAQLVAEGAERNQHVQHLARNNRHRRQRIVDLEGIIEARQLEIDRIVEVRQLEAAELRVRLEKGARRRQLLESELEQERAESDRRWRTARDLRGSQTYRAGRALSDARTWKGFWLLIPRLYAIYTGAQKEIYR